MFRILGVKPCSSEYFDFLHCFIKVSQARGSQGRSKLFSPLVGFIKNCTPHPGEDQRAIFVKIICVAKDLSSLAAQEWRITFAVQKVNNVLDYGHKR